MSWMGRWALVALAWAAQGCYSAHDADGSPIGPLAGDGVVRVELQLPLPPSPDFRFVRIEAVDAERCPFGGACSASDDHVFPLEESNSVPCAMVYGDTPQSVNVLVRLCREEDCLGLDDVDYWMSIERPFYPGITTVVRRPVEAFELFDEDPTEVARCEVEGCSTGDASSYCLLSGEHFCEADTAPVERPTSCTSEHAISIAPP